jgi:transposase
MMGVADDMPSLPEDPVALRALLLATLEQRDAAMAERDALAVRNEQLHHLLLKLKRQFGQKSERLPEDQLLFAFEEIEATLAASEAEMAKNSKGLKEQQARRRRGNRGQLPAHLPRIEQC